jgi:hypothetical protein
MLFDRHESGRRHAAHRQHSDFEEKFRTSGFHCLFPTIID